MPRKPLPGSLVADIGGTHARFGIVAASGGVTLQRVLRCAAFPDPGSAVEAYLGEAAPPDRPRRAAFAVASPVARDRIEMTNHLWDFSIEETRSRLGLESLVVVNDFHALALSLPVLTPGDVEEVKEGRPVGDAPLALLGPGTGLGVSGLVYHRGDWIALSTEGGHRTLTATTDLEWEVFRVLKVRHGHVSAERVLSGPGLVGLYSALREIGGSGELATEAAEIVRRARQRDDGVAAQATSLFSGWLGSVAGDLALTLGARGGVYLGGGMLPKMGTTFSRDRFTERFVAKGRFREYLEPIPVRMVVHPTAALLGVAEALAAAGDPVSEGRTLS